MGFDMEGVDDECFEVEREALVEQLSRGPTEASANAKLAIARAARATLDEQLDIESELQRKCGLTDDYREGVSAFKERRPPRFTGR